MTQGRKPFWHYCPICGEKFYSATMNCPRHYKKKADYGQLHVFFDNALESGRDIPLSKLKELAEEFGLKIGSVTNMARSYGYYSKTVYTKMKK